MQISYYYNKNNPLSLPHNDPQYGEPSPLKQMELKQMLAECSNIPENTPKSGSGQIYAFIADKFYKIDYLKDNDYYTDGACFCDIDDLSEEDNKKILDSFDELTKILPNLTAVWKSFSGNLHFVFWTECLDAKEYEKQELTALLYLAITIKKICGITLTDFLTKGNGKKQIDESNSSFSQRFFLNRITKDSIKYNDDAIPANFDYFTKDKYGELNKYWPYILKLIKQQNIKEVRYINTNIEYNTVSTSNEQIEYIEHRKRWRIYTTFKYLFKTQEKTDAEWYRFSHRIPEKHPISFYIEEPNKNHWWIKDHPSGPKPSMLKKYGYDIEKISNDDHTIKKGEWLEKYSDEILEFIKNHKKAEIIGPTGSGKTTFINGAVYEEKIFETEFSLAKELNAIVIVPFNTTNKLYDSLIEISSETGSKDIREDKQYVMIWDQALNNWEAIKNRTLIIDEAHCLFLDRTYRDVAVKLMNKLIEDDCKIILFTATPVGEAEELGCEVLRYTNERDIIDLNMLKVNHVDMAEYGCIYKCLDENKFDRIVLFDDMHAKKIWEKFMIDGKYINDIAYIRADTKNTKEFIELRDKELLTKKLTICTCVAFNGLNFKNKGEKILVISSYREGYTTACEIIQETGRIRRSKVTSIVYYDGKEYESTLEDRIDKAQTYQEGVITLGMPDSLLSYDRRLTKYDVVDALKKIENKLKEESKKETVIQRLIDCGYYEVTDKDLQSDGDKGDRIKLEIKRKESREFKQELMEDCLGEYNEESYKGRWKKRIDNIINNKGYTGIDIDLFKEYIRKKNDNTLIDTIITNIERIIKVCLINENDWNNYVTRIDLLRNTLKTETDKRDLMKQYNDNKKIRKKYSDKVIVTEDEKYDLNGVIVDLFDELEQQAKEEREKRQEVKNKKIKHLESGLEFNSMIDAANYFNKRPETMTRWLKYGILVKM